MFSLDIRITEKKIVNPDGSSSSESISDNSSTSSNKTNKSKSKSMASSSLRHRDHLVINNTNNENTMQRN